MGEMAKWFMASVLKTSIVSKTNRKGKIIFVLGN